MAGVHADRVHHPGHDLRVGIDVGCWDIPIGPDQDADLAGVAAGQVLQLVTAQPLGIHDHSTLCSAVGDPDHGALPGHPHRHCPYPIHCDARVIAEATLGWAAIEVVMHPE